MFKLLAQRYTISVTADYPETFVDRNLFVAALFIYTILDKKNPSTLQGRFNPVQLARVVSTTYTK